MVELKVNRPQHVPGDVGVRPANPSIRKPQTDHSGPSFSNILAERVAPAGGHDNITIPILPVPLLRNFPNGCAATSLAMVLMYYGVIDENYDYDAAGYTFTDSPQELHDYAESEFGVRAELVHFGTINDLCSLIDGGIPPIIYGGEGGSGHCVVLCGYEKDATGQVTKVYLNDPNRAGVVEMSYDDFMSFWQSGSVGSDYKYVALVKPGSAQDDYLKQHLIVTNRAYCL